MRCLSLLLAICFYPRESAGASLYSLKCVLMVLVTFDSNLCRRAWQMIYRLLVGWETAKSHLMWDLSAVSVIFHPDPHGHKNISEATLRKKSKDGE